MAVLFDYRKDAFSEYLREFGYYLGRFIYIMDAYDDLPEDKKNGCFNPFLQAAEQEGFEKEYRSCCLMKSQQQGMFFKNFPVWNMQIFLEIYYMQESGTVMTRYK